MSNQRFTMGLMALLQDPVGDLHTEEWGTLSEKLYDSGCGLFLTYGGDMIVYRHIDEVAYESGLRIFRPNDKTMSREFSAALVKAGIAIIPQSIQGFVDNWYDGADPNHIDLTREDAGYGSKDAVPVRQE